MYSSPSLSHSFNISSTLDESIAPIPVISGLDISCLGKIIYVTRLSLGKIIPNEVLSFTSILVRLSLFQESVSLTAL